MTTINEHAISVIHLLLCGLWAFVAYIHGFRRGMVFGWCAAKEVPLQIGRGEFEQPPTTEPKE